MTSLHAKIALVTGSSRGIGRAIAIRLAHEGAKIVLTGRDEAKLQQTADVIQEAGGVTAARAVDLRSPEAATELVQFTLETYGALDILVNNAGATKRGDFLTLTDADFEDGFALKYYGAVRLTRAAWPSLRGGQGSVLNIIGVGGRTPGAEFTIGGSVNAALLSFTKAIADLGIGDGVQVNAINPGRVRTDRLTNSLPPAGPAREAALENLVRQSNITRIGEPDEIAALAAFIVSPQGRWMHGSLVDMDGGQTKTI